MNRRMLVAVSLLLTLALVSATAGAQEIRISTLTTPATWMTPDGSELRHQLALARMHAESATPFQLEPPMKEVRLSSGAKTAIIITAIVVGALIIVGAVALSRPGKKLP